MGKPTTKAIRARLEQRGVKPDEFDSWARFFTGLDWKIINPLVRMATASGVHPVLAAGMTANSTRDQDIRATLQAHLEAKAALLQADGPSTGATSEDTPAP